MTDHSPVVDGQLLAEKQDKSKVKSLNLVSLWRGQWPCAGHKMEIVWVILGGFMNQYGKNITSKKHNFLVSS